jgi:hypothetical protein
MKNLIIRKNGNVTFPKSLSLSQQSKDLNDTSYLAIRCIIDIIFYQMNKSFKLKLYFKKLH